MRFPLADHVNIIKELHNVIPHNRDINLLDIENIEKSHRIGLQAYIRYTFPSIISHSDNIRFFLAACNQIYSDIPKGSLVIAPGDSPSRIVRMISLLYNTEAGKSIKFIKFPLSSSAKEIYPSLIDDYLRKQIIPTDNMIYLDYIGSGRNHTLILESLQRITGNSELKFSILDIKKYLPLNDFFICIISSAETIQARYFPIYKLEESLETIDIFRANVLIAFLYLEYKKPSPDFSLSNSIPKIASDSLLNESIVEIHYYDIQKLRFINEIVVWRVIDEDSDRVNIISSEGIERPILIKSIVSLNYKQPVKPLVISPGFITATLIDDSQISGYYTGSSYDTGDGKGLRIGNGLFTEIKPWIPEIHTESNSRKSNRDKLIKMTSKFLYEIEYYRNGILIKETIYVTRILYDNIEYIKSSDFILNRRVPNFYWLNCYLITKAIPFPNETFTINGIQTISYRNGNITSEVTYSWATTDDYYESKDGTFRLLRAITM